MDTESQNFRGFIMIRQPVSINSTGRLTEREGRKRPTTIKCRPFNLVKTWLKSWRSSVLPQEDCLLHNL